MRCAKHFNIQNEYCLQVMHKMINGPVRLSYKEGNKVGFQLEPDTAVGDLRARLSKASLEFKKNSRTIQHVPEQFEKPCPSVESFFKDHAAIVISPSTKLLNARHWKEIPKFVSFVGNKGSLRETAG